MIRLSCVPHAVNKPQQFANGSNLRTLDSPDGGDTDFQPQSVVKSYRLTVISAPNTTYIE
jgi:hypothetical protein